MYCGKNIFLRAIEEEDLPLIHKYYNNTELSYLIDTHPAFPMTLLETKDYLREKNADTHKSYQFALCESSSNSLIGLTGYFGLSCVSQNAKIFIFIANKEVRGKGYGKEALKLLLDFLFYELNLRKVSLEVFGSNEVARKTYLGLAFKEEGILKEQCYKNGRYHDLILMALFRKDYKK